MEPDPSILKRKCRHVDWISVTGCIGSCQFFISANLEILVNMISYPFYLLSSPGMPEIVKMAAPVQPVTKMSLKHDWHHNYSDVIMDNGRDSVSNHQSHHCLFRCRSKKAPKLPVIGLCAGNSPVTGEFPAQMASDAENVSIRWRHHDTSYISHTTLNIHGTHVMSLHCMNDTHYTWVYKKNR